MVRHWVCIVEVDTDKLPNGFDNPPRRGVMNAIEKKGIVIKNCWSGWGTPEKVIKKLKDIWFSEDSE